MKHFMISCMAVALTGTAEADDLGQSIDQRIIEMRLLNLEKALGTMEMRQQMMEEDLDKTKVKLSTMEMNTGMSTGMQKQMQQMRQELQQIQQQLQQIQRQKP